MRNGIHTLPDALAAAAGSGEGIIFLVDGIEQRRSYAELRQGALRFPAALNGSGLRRGDVVALAIEEAEPFLTALLGASMARVIPLSLAPPAMTADLSGYAAVTATILRTACARAIVASARLVPALHALRPTCPALEVILSRADLPAAPRQPARTP